MPFRNIHFMTKRGPAVFTIANFGANTVAIIAESNASNNLLSSKKQERPNLVIRNRTANPMKLNKSALFFKVIR